MKPLFPLSPVENTQEPETSSSSWGVRRVERVERAERIDRAVHVSRTVCTYVHLHMYVPTYPTYIRMVWYGMYLLETDSTAAKPAYIKRHAMLQMEYVVDVVGTSRPAIRLPLDATRLDAT